MTKIKRIKLVNFRRFLEGVSRHTLDVRIPEEYSTIMIVGNNGVGKSTFLNELNLLPSINDSYDIIEGEIGEKIVEFTHNHIDYILTYVYKPNGRSHSCSADLVRYEHGKRIQINSTSSVNEVRNIIKKMTGIDNKLIKLTALNSEEKGIVHMKTGVRREYIHAISPIGDIKDLVKNVNEKYSYFKRTKEANELKLNSMPSYESMVTDIDTLKERKDKLLKQMGEYDVSSLMSDEDIYTLDKKIKDMDFDLKIVENFISTINERKLLTSIREHNERINFKIGECQGTITSLMDNIATSSQYLKSSTVYSLKEVHDIKAEMLKHQFLKFDHTNYFEHEWELVRARGALRNISESIIEIRQEGKVSLQSLLSIDVEKENEKLKTTHRKLIQDISLLEEEKDKNYVSNYSINNVRPSEECNVPTCELRLQFEDMNNKLAKYNDIVDKLSATKKELYEVNDGLDNIRYIQSELNKLNNIYTIIENTEELKMISNIFDSKRKFIEHLKYGGSVMFEEESFSIFENTNIYLDYMEIENKYKEATNERVTEARENIATWNRKLQETISIKDELQKDIIRTLDNTFVGLNMNELKSKREEILVDIQDSKTLYNREVSKKEEYKKYLDGGKAILEEIDEIDKSLENLNFDVKLYSIISEELKTNISDEADTFKIKETITKHLPVKVMRNLMLNLKDITNEFLEMCDMKYRIHDFEVTSKDFNVMVQKGSYVKDDISKMSEGEKAIMGLASTLALRKIMLPEYSIFTADETDSTLSKENKRKYFDIINNFSRTKELQLFAVSHNEYFNTGNEDNVGVLELKPDGELSVVSFSTYI